MRRRMAMATWAGAALVSALLLAGVALAQPAPEFRLGFKALAEQIPDVVGGPLENERHAANGDSVQRTSTGLMVWRKADNWTAFTDGHRTWLSGPNGLENRLNGESLLWEGRLSLEQLRNAEYTLLLALDPGRGERETAVRLANGEAAFPEQRVQVRLVEEPTAHGDLDGDGSQDAVVLLALNTGGSGTFEYAVAVLNDGSAPRQVAREYLGDRVRVNSFAIAGGRASVDMVTHGPADPLCCPTQQVVKDLGFQLPAASLGSLVGTYAATLPAADAPGRRVTLILAPDGTATLSTEFLDRPPPASQTGTWTGRGSTAAVVLTEAGGRQIRNEIAFELRGDDLVSVQWDRSLYGSDGLRLARQP